MWDCGPRTQVKLHILDKYLNSWFNILKVNFTRVVYLDTFCGPGKYTTGEDGSPIVAMKQAEKALKGFPDFKPVFIFIDNDKQALDNLKQLEEFKRLSTIFSVYIYHGNFAEVIGKALEQASITTNTPLFSFVDPFNVKVVPFKIVSQLMRNKEHSELFVNFFGGATNRCYNHPTRSTSEQVERVLGKTIVIPDNETDRLKVIFDTYQKQLGTLAHFVRKFQFRDETNVRDNALYFVGRYVLGFIKMKEAMWKMDPVDGGQFSEHSHNKGGDLFGTHSNEPYLHDLKKDLVKKFGKQTQIKMSIIDQWIMHETSYLTTHLRKGGGLMEALYNEGKIKYFDPEGKRRAKNNWVKRLLIDFL